jgi:two-component system cell cycle sensor histidine kinase PleC
MTETAFSAPAFLPETPTAADLVTMAEPLSARQSCGEVFAWFIAHPEAPAAAILDEQGAIVGLVNRLIFLTRYARQYAPELYSKKSILRLANPDPLVVDQNVRIADLGATLLMENPDALIECFVITAHGRYLGIVTGEDLLRCKVSLLQAREAELSQALAAANAASRAKSNFLALMSHELRTPLNAIIGFSELMDGELFGPLGHKRYRDYARDIHGAGSHLLALINDILDLSKAEAGKFDLMCQDFSVTELIEDCLRLVREWAGTLKLVEAVAPDTPWLHADRLRVKQILLNLLSNAVKFTPEGGTVRAAAEMAADGSLVLTVSDTGIGMAPEMIPLALEPFRQIASPFARNVEGTGLGLSLVKSMVEAHGGTLQIDSALNAGTTVRALFPAARVVAGSGAARAS